MMKIKTKPTQHLLILRLLLEILTKKSLLDSNLTAWSQVQQLIKVIKNFRSQLILSMVTGSQPLMIWKSIHCPSSTITKAWYQIWKWIRTWKVQVSPRKTQSLWSSVKKWSPRNSILQRVKFSNKVLSLSTNHRWKTSFQCKTSHHFSNPSWKRQKSLLKLANPVYSGQWLARKLGLKSSKIKWRSTVTVIWQMLRISFLVIDHQDFNESNDVFIKRQ